MSNKISIQHLAQKESSGEKITVLTAYDYPFAALLDQAEIDVILVGDSLANVMLGMESTREISMDEMISHAKAVSLAVKRALVVGDMPFEAYQVDPTRTVANARRFMDEAKCDAVKVEWFDDCLQVVRDLVAQDIPVMGHIGLTPQTADKLGGFKVQGKEVESAQAIFHQAHELELAGCFSLVLECVPSRLAELITSRISIPTIGIGAGPHCNGQVLVVHDILGLYDKFRPKFVKQYADLGAQVRQAAETYRQEVLSGQFPTEEQSFAMSEDDYRKLKEIIDLREGE